MTCHCRVSLNIVTKRAYFSRCGVRTNDTMRYAWPPFNAGAKTMSKAQDSKKETKKAPAKTMKEKKEAKKVKQDEKNRTGP
jgi:hypothetical protein